MAVRHEGPGHLHTAGPHAPTRASTRGHDIFRPPAFASRSSCSRRGVGPSSRSAYRTQRRAGPRRGYPVPHARAATGEGALYTPGTTVLTPTEATSGRAPAASQRPVPAPRHTSHRRGSRLTRHQRGFTQFARPVFPSPVAARMERAALGLSPGLRTPPTRSRTTHARVGTGHRARTWNYTLNSHSSISNPVVHSLCATSRRTSPYRSSAG